MSRREYYSTSYTEGSYLLTADDFPEGCLVVTDVLTGTHWITGQCPRGDVVRVPLDTPLCGVCDKPIRDDKCDDCRIVFREPLTETIGNPLGNPFDRKDAA